MRKAFAIAVAVLAVATASFADKRGAWTASTEEEDPGKIHLSVTMRKFNHWGQSWGVSRFTGLTDEIVQAKAQTPVEFKMQSEAGTIAYAGTFKEGFGAGQLRFTPDPRYRQAVRKLGLDFDLDSDRTEEDELFTLAMWDVSIAYIRTMLGIFPDSTFRDIRRARGVDVSPESIKNMRALNLEVGSLREAARLAGSGVTPEYVRSMRAAGVEITDADQARRLAGSGVTPKFVAELAAAGYKNLTPRELSRLAGSGVTSEFIRQMSKKQ